VEASNAGEANRVGAFGHAQPPDPYGGRQRSYQDGCRVQPSLLPLVPGNQWGEPVNNEIGPQLVAAFSSIIRRVRALETSAGSTGDVPSSVIAVLGHLADDGELRLGALATSLRVDTSVISRTVAGAEHLGLVSRRPDPRDGRACLLSVTERGRQILTDRRNQRLRLLSSVTQGWEPGAAEALLAGLTRLRDDLAAPRDVPAAA
jgi:DNA-binding MarR family transcriptional regulator